MAPLKDSGMLAQALAAMPAGSKPSEDWCSHVPNKGESASGGLIQKIHETDPLCCPKLVLAKAGMPGSDEGNLGHRAA